VAGWIPATDRRGAGGTTELTPKAGVGGDGGSGSSSEADEGPIGSMLKAIHARRLDGSSPKTSRAGPTTTDVRHASGSCATPSAPSWPARGGSGFSGTAPTWGWRWRGGARVVPLRGPVGTFVLTAGRGRRFGWPGATGRGHASSMFPGLSATKRRARRRGASWRAGGARRPETTRPRGAGGARLADVREALGRRFESGLGATAHRGRWRRTTTALTDGSRVGRRTIDGRPQRWRRRAECGRSSSRPVSRTRAPLLAAGVSGRTPWAARDVVAWLDRYTREGGRGAEDFLASAAPADETARRRAGGRGGAVYWGCRRSPTAGGCWPRVGRGDVVLVLGPASGQASGARRLVEG